MKKFIVKVGAIIVMTAVIIGIEGMKAQIVINEIMPCNVSFVMDEYMNYSMWVEVFNTGDADENLGNYFFTDNIDVPEKWKPQKRTVYAKRFERIWFEREENAGHSSFKLDPEGGILYLTRDRQVVDSVVYPRQFRNVSWGRTVDGGSEWNFFVQPSTYINKMIIDPVTAVTSYDTWNWYYKTTPPPYNWNETDFDDSAWHQENNAPLGYGKQVNTIIGSPMNPPAQTAYFRKTVNISDVSKINDMYISGMIDDAVAIFINGTEVYRYNLPGGEINYSMAAVTARVEPSTIAFFAPATVLVEGKNVIAAEVHQSGDLHSSDLFFELEIIHNKKQNSTVANPYSNNGKETADRVSAIPEFTIPAGFYSQPVDVSFNQPAEGETIRYTTDGSEPDSLSIIFNGTPINLTKTTCIRAATFSSGSIQNKIATATYFVGERQFTLPVVSIVTDPDNLYDYETGIYTEGWRRPENYWWDWCRPANFEIFDSLGVQRLSQELDISCGGMYSREHAQKTLKISPRYKFGDNRLRYDFFESKKGKRYKDIQIRNSGNDYGSTMLRDGFMQTLIINRLDIDYLAYQPAVCFINGEYFGVENIRERSSKDYLYTNYDLEEGEFSLLDQYSVSTNGDWLDFRDYLINSSNPASDAVYKYAQSKLDIESYIDYFISEMYYANYDWIVNNYKIWKPLFEDGLWRFILYDTDYGFGLMGNYDMDMVMWVFNHNENYMSIPMRQLIKNSTFLQKFIDRFCIHLSTTFNPVRVNRILDSLSKKIAPEMVYHRLRFGRPESFASEIAVMKNFANQRADNVLQHLSDYFKSSAVIRSVSMSSTSPATVFTFNGEYVPDPAPVTVKYFRNSSIRVTASDIDHKTFDHWEYISTPGGNVQEIYDREFSATLANNVSLKAVYRTTGIDHVNPDGNKIAVAIRFFNLLGQEVKSDAEGVIIKRIIYSDGTTESEKTFLR
ncbi:MAG: CotH kinase family protein [Dysgonamonadaceae bacterium]|jgi:hypothetical protein|nr:CotH kinase family protein [Dysgonamonadaceae bacterium]